jgi:hypothetical protein
MEMSKFDPRLNEKMTGLGCQGFGLEYVSDLKTDTEFSDAGME